jgi:glycosyltransferase involved in cell wall biosynthesis
MSDAPARHNLKLASAMENFVPTIFIVSYERPIYLWATLDSVYRNTKTNANVVLIDSGSQDPLVHSVIDGFSRRGLFKDVLRHRENNDEWAAPLFNSLRHTLGQIFYYLDGDVVVLDSGNCWVQQLRTVMEENPRLAMVGSSIDKCDFADPESIEKRIGGALSTGEKQQLKFYSPERTREPIGPTEVSPLNPPGRLLALRTAPVHEHLGDFMRHNDDKMHRILKSNGWDTGIYGGVVHRHLSLCNFFDYPEYSMVERDRYYFPDHK